MADEFAHPKLSNLSPAARATVEAALKETLERQITAVGGDVDRKAAHSRSQGAFFSRSKTTKMMDEMAREQDARGQDAELLKHVTTLDDTGFAKFTERLAQVKSIAKTPK